MKNEGRFNWLREDDIKQVFWLRDYCKKKGIFQDMVRANDTFISHIKSTWGSSYDRAPRTREEVRLTKAAWYSYSKKDKNASYSISSEAKKSLLKIAKKNKTTKTKTVENLILQAENLNKMELQFRRLLQQSEARNPDISSITFNLESLHGILSIEELKSKLTSLKSYKREQDLKEDQYELLEEKAAKIAYENTDLVSCVFR